MNFGDAITLLKAGHKLQRKGWNGVGMWVEMQNPDDNSKMTLPYLYLNYPDGRTVPWLASQTDMLCDDWAEYKEPDMTKVANVFELLPQQVQAIKDAGFWDDPIKRAKMIKRYHEESLKAPPKKLHWTQTPEGKKKMAARKRRGTKK